MSEKQEKHVLGAVAVNPERRFLLKHIRFDKFVVKAQGHYLFDDTGCAYLDALAQYGALPFGHNPPAIWERLMQARQDSAPGFVQPLLSRHADELAAKLLAVLPPSMRYVTYVNSGAEATEAAIKLVRAKTHRPLILSFAGGFHGKTTGALMCTGNAHYREPFLLDYGGFEVLGFGDLEMLTTRLQAGNVAGVFIEPIQGEGGMRCQPTGFLAEVSSLCHRHGALLVLDEVQSGLGRSGSMFAFEHEAGVEPDIVLLAKALGGGLLPLGAVVCNTAAWSPAFGSLHSSTFANSDLACAVGCAVLDELARDDSKIVRHAQAMGERLGAGLAALAQRYPEQWQTTPGRGLMQGLRLLPWDGEQSYFAAHASQLGYAVPIVAGYLLNEHRVLTAPVFNQNNVLRIQPALTIEAAEIDRILAALQATSEVLARGDHAEVFGYMAQTRSPPACREPAPLYAVPRQAAAPDAASKRLGSFAFLIHPTDDQVLFDTLPEEFARLDAAGRDAWQRWMHSWFSKMHEPAVVYHQPVIASKLGGHVEGWLIACPLTPAQLMRLPRPKRERLLEQYVEAARRLGVDIVGLGAFTSVISRGGADIAGCGLNLTTGNSLTALASAGTLFQAAAHAGLDAACARAAVIGAAGSVGRLAAIALSERFGALELVGNSQNTGALPALQEVAGEIYGHAIRGMAQGRLDGIAVALGDKLLQRLRNLAEEAARVPAAQRLFLHRLLSQTVDDALGDAAPLRLTTDVMHALGCSEVVLSATSSSRSFIEPHWLRAGAVVCDVARPLDVLHQLKGQRADVWVFEGGVMRLPQDIAFGRQNVLGYPRGLNLACLSETITLAMEGATRHYSVGPRIDFEEARWILDAALGHGFVPHLVLTEGSAASAAVAAQAAAEVRVAASPLA
jgi:acetylornithine/succinyldiaminopimelate/putrescine aminotransferase/predicted amino acid dehydrogenase